MLRPKNREVLKANRITIKKKNHTHCCHQLQVRSQAEVWDLGGICELCYAEAIREDAPVSGDKAGPALATEDFVIYKPNQKRGQGSKGSVGGYNPPQVVLPCLALVLQDVFSREGVVFFRAHARLQQRNGPRRAVSQLREILQAQCREPLLWINHMRKE